MVAETTEAKKNGTVDPEGFVEVQIDRPSLKFENDTKREGNDEIYTGQAYQGYLAAYFDFGERLDEETEELRATGAYVLQLTKPGKAFDRDGKPIKRAIGEEVLLWPNVRLDQAIAAAAGVEAKLAAQHPTHMIHMRITPIKRAPFKNKAGVTQRMWQFKVEVAPRPVVRAGKTALGLLAGSAAAPKLIDDNVS